MTTITYTLTCDLCGKKVSTEPFQLLPDGQGQIPKIAREKFFHRDLRADVCLDHAIEIVEVRGHPGEVKWLPIHRETAGKSP